MFLRNKNTAQIDEQAIQAHMADTYFALRRGLGLLAIAFPFFLYLYGRHRHGLDLQPSMSAYFFAATMEQCASFPMRTFFVGFLFAIGVGLLLYRGFTPLENYLLNAAGVLAVMVAIFPERINPADAADNERIKNLFENCPAIVDWAATQQTAWPIHYISAVALFVMLAGVALFCANKTLDYLPPEKQAQFRGSYKVLGIAMLLFPVGGYAVALLLRDVSSVVFWIEATGIIVFGIYWLQKSRELQLSGLEKQPEAAMLVREQNLRPGSPAGDSGPPKLAKPGRA